MGQHSKTAIVAAPILFVCLWSTGFIVSRLTAGHVEPFTFLAIRFPLAALLVAALALALGQNLAPSRQSLHATAAGVFLHAAYLAPVFWAVTHGLPAGVAALITGLQPLITIFLAVPLLGERVDGRHWLGLGVGLAGLLMVLWPKFTMMTLDGVTPATVGMVAAGTLSLTFGTVYQKRYVTTLPLVSSLFWQYASAGAVALTLAAAFESFRFDGSAEAWMGLGWSVIMNSLVSILALMLLIRRGEVAKVSTLIFMVPGVTAVMAYALFGERLTLLQIGGMLVTAAAVIIVNRKTA